MTLLQCAFILLIVGAAGGAALTLLTIFRFGFPRWLGMAHGLLNIVGIIILFVSNLTDGDAVVSARWWAFVILASALCGGVLFFRAIFRDRIPIAAAVLHGALALGGLYILAPTTGLI